MTKEISRREFIKATATAALAAGLLPGSSPSSSGDTVPEKVDLAVVEAESAQSATVAAIEALGGIGKFVKAGDVVLIKPNMAFPNPSTWGSTTNPEVVNAVARLCLDAGARAILVVDHPMAQPERCLQRTGIDSSCKKLGSRKIRVSMATEHRDYTEVELDKGKALNRTEVHKAFLRADVFINVPVAKSHSATGVSFGMKNIMGLIWDRRYLHQEIDLQQGIADLSTFIKPALIIVDATRSLITGGPQGPGRTVNLKTVIAGTDPVATDAQAVALSTWNGRKYTPSDVAHIVAASDMKLGEIDLQKLSISSIKANG